MQQGSRVQGSRVGKQFGNYGRKVSGYPGILETSNSVEPQILLLRGFYAGYSLFTPAGASLTLPYPDDIMRIVRMDHFMGVILSITFVNKTGLSDMKAGVIRF